MCLSREREHREGEKKERKTKTRVAEVVLQTQTAPLAVSKTRLTVRWQKWLFNPPPLLQNQLIQGLGQHYQPGGTEGPVDSRTGRHWSQTMAVDTRIGAVGVELSWVLKGSVLASLAGYCHCRHLEGRGRRWVGEGRCGGGVGVMSVFKA